MNRFAVYFKVVGYGLRRVIVDSPPGLLLNAHQARAYAVLQLCARYSVKESSLIFSHSKELAPRIRRIKTLDIQGKDWLDRPNGNHYFSARVVINFGLPDEHTIYIPFQYGHGTQFLQQAGIRLHELGYIKEENTALWGWCKANKVILRHNIDHGCKKAEVINFGKP